MKKILLIICLISLFLISCGKTEIVNTNNYDLQDNDKSIDTITTSETYYADKENVEINIPKVDYTSEELDKGLGYLYSNKGEKEMVVSSVAYNPDMVTNMANIYEVNCPSGVEVYCNHSSYSKSVFLLGEECICFGNRDFADVADVINTILTGTQPYLYPYEKNGINYVMMIWEINNGYLVIYNTLKKDGSLWDGHSFFAYFKDLSYINYISQTFESEDNNSNDTNNDDLQTFDEIEVNSWKDAYINLIRQMEIETADSNNPSYKLDNTYSLYDIDKDGTPEIFICTGTCSADKKTMLYSFYDGNFQLIDSYKIGNAKICGISIENSFITQRVGMGYQYIYRYEYIDKKLVEYPIMEGIEVEEYMELESIPSYPFSNESGLNWNENPSENNYDVLLPYFAG